MTKMIRTVQPTQKNDRMRLLKIKQSDITVINLFKMFVCSRPPPVQVIERLNLTDAATDKYNHRRMQIYGAYTTDFNLNLGHKFILNSYQMQKQVLLCGFLIIESYLSRYRLYDLEILKQSGYQSLFRMQLEWMVVLVVLPPSAPSPDTKLEGFIRTNSEQNTR